MMSRMALAVGIVTVCCVGSFIGIIGCDRKSPRPRNGRVPAAGSLIVVVGPSADDPTWPAIAGGARRFAKSVPHLSFDYVAPATDNAVDRRRIISQCITRKPKAICLFVPPSLNPADSGAPSDTADPIVPLALDIVQHDILLVTMGRQLDDNARVYAHVAVDLASAAEQVGRALAVIAGDKHSYLLLHERGRDEISTRICERFELAARFETGVTLLREQRAAATAKEQRRQISQMLTLFPNAGLIVTLTSRLWLEPPVAAFKAPARFVTLSSSPSLWPRLARKEAAALAGPLHGQIGYVAASKAWAGLIAEEPYGRVEVIPCELITPQDLDDFAKRYAESADIPLEQLWPKE